jgi:hypothetical protein
VILRDCDMHINAENEGLNELIGNKKNSKKQSDED